MKLTYTAVLFKREPETVTSPKLVATSLQTFSFNKTFKKTKTTKKKNFSSENGYYLFIKIQHVTFNIHDYCCRLKPNVSN